MRGIVIVLFVTTNFKLSCTSDSHHEKGGTLGHESFAKKIDFCFFFDRFQNDYDAQAWI